MAKDDGMGEKTEPATPKRREEAREKGQVAKSQDLTGAVVMLLGFASLKLLGFWLGPTVIGYFSWPLANLDSPVPGTQTIYAGAAEGLGSILVFLAPLLAILFLVAAAVTAMQVGLSLAPKAFELDINKLNPISGMQKLFSIRSITKLLLGLAKMAIIAAVLWMFIASELDNVMAALRAFDGENNNVGPVIVKMLDLVLWLGIYAGGVLTIIGLIDWSYQKWQLNEDLKMSKHEVKEEMKNMDGDPQIKRKRLERARKMAQGRMMAAVPEADVIVTNPTHYSIALRYRESDPAPRVIAKGKDLVALKIREVASENRVPIVEKPELARALFRWVEVDEFVPDQYWGAVAEVLAYVYNIDERRKKRALGAGVN